MLVTPDLFGDWSGHGRNRSGCDSASLHQAGFLFDVMHAGNGKPETLGDFTRRLALLNSGNDLLLQCWGDLGTGPFGGFFGLGCLTGFGSLLALAWSAIRGVLEGFDEAVDVSVTEAVREFGKGQLTVAYQGLFLLGKFGFGGGELIQLVNKWHRGIERVRER